MFLFRVSFEFAELSASFVAFIFIFEKETKLTNPLQSFCFFTLTEKKSPSVNAFAFKSRFYQNLLIALQVAFWSMCFFPSNILFLWILNTKEADGCMELISLFQVEIRSLQNKLTHKCRTTKKDNRQRPHTKKNDNNNDNVIISLCIR